MKASRYFKQSCFFGLIISTGLCISFYSIADPVSESKQLRDAYIQQFPKLALQDYADGVYAIDPEARESWLAIEEFPPYEPSIDTGKAAFKKTFTNGKTYADCFPKRGIGITQTYPKWDADTQQVVTLALAINLCRILNKEPPLPYLKGEIADISAYMAWTSRGNKISITLPISNALALDAYEKGRNYYYQRRGQLNFSCASCHVQNAGKKIRSETLSPLLGQVSGWPTYRLKWGEMGTLHRRFIGCHKQIRAKPPVAQSQAFRHLEFFMSYISNGIAVNGPSTRK